ncbi:DHA2 family efflux MFS transporter permease subunit [Terricaulis sp.]|uniref:DHA2 family efflux MFS transporter permease subunit n=1 Tax=Terricaulis sp. TaxID=2768686 RepID=UPI002AC569C4|nr:DHA2 family efflux MFS transporter permease subunit [Terricaulis sp.]MDZ4690392.1 DHA2 family efflux MFS transporter permease subunit [Terricaulis sp.]
MNAAAPAAKPDDSPPLAIWIGFIAMVVGQFMAILDIQIVASAIGSIQAGVSASRDEISWVQTAYLIAEVIGIPLSGFLGRALGTRLLFCISALAFSFASLLCAFSWDIGSLIFFRALQGFSGAAMIPTVMATLYLAFPQRLQAMTGAMMGMVITLAPSLGPTIGGYVAEMLGWRALFWVNVVPGVIITAIIWNTMGSLDKPNFNLLKKIDLIGLFGLALFLGAAEYTLEEGPANEWFASGEVVTWALVSAAGAALFFYRAFKVETPIVDLKPFGSPTFAIGAGLGFILGLGLFSSVFLTPLFLGSVRGYSALQIGHTMFVQGAVMFLSAPIIGRLGRTMPDTRALGFLGFMLVALSCWVQAHLTAEAGFWEMAWPQVLRALGLMMTFTSVMQPALQSLPPQLVHAGAGLFNTMRNLGGAFGIAALATVQAHSYALHRQELYAAADPNNPHIAGMIAGAQSYLEQAGAADPERQALMRYASLLDREALVMTFNDQFLLLAVVIGLSAFAMLALKPRPKMGGAPAKLDEALAH